MAIFLNLLRVFVVVGEHCKSKAENLFHDLGVQVVTGHRYLGGFIGDLHDRDVFVHRKVIKWVNYVNTLILVILHLLSLNLPIQLLLDLYNMSGHFCCECCQTVACCFKIWSLHWLPIFCRLFLE